MSPLAPTQPMVELSVAELRLITEHFAGMTLPGFVPVAPDDTDARAVLHGLQERGVVAVTAELSDADWTSVTAAPVVMAFVMMSATDLVFESRGWDDLGITDHFAALTSDGVAHVVQRQTEGAEPVLSIGRGPLDELWGALMSGVPTYEVEHQASGSATIGMVESQALVSAWQQPDRRVVDAVVSELHLTTEAAELFRGLAQPARRGFRLKVHSAGAGLVFAGNWVGTANGWLRMSAGMRRDADGARSGAPVTAQTLTDEGTVTAIAETREQLGNDLLGLIAGLVRGRIDAAQDNGGATNG
jgi:hypothetical protein